MRKQLSPLENFLSLLVAVTTAIFPNMQIKDSPPPNLVLVIYQVLHGSKKDIVPVWCNPNQFNFRSEENTGKIRVTISIFQEFSLHIFFQSFLFEVTITFSLHNKCQQYKEREGESSQQGHGQQKNLEIKKKPALLTLYIKYLKRGI